MALEKPDWVRVMVGSSGMEIEFLGFKSTAMPSLWEVMIGVRSWLLSLVLWKPLGA